jgi:NAD(P)-dependent dehydrogenase (short-subunit alcohol dehydrogenase family)
MELTGRHVVVTGGGSGIGAAMVERIAAENPRGIVVADIDAENAREVALRTGAVAIQADVGHESEIQRIIARAEERYGPIDVFISNAGLARPLGGPEIGDAGWQRLWEVHVMAHVWAARALLPAMIERGDGYLVNTASAAGLLMSPGAIPYSVTKHAAVSLAESLAVLYGRTGVRFSCICPALVNTPLMFDVDDESAGRAVRIGSMALEAEDVAEIAVRGIINEHFLILTHPDETTAASRLRAVDPDGFVATMQDIWLAATKVDLPL